MAKILIYDIETAPLEAYTWGIYDQNVGLNQIKKDWHLLSFAAKWYGKKDIIYRDQRKVRDVENDKKLVQELWTLLDEADIVLTQNGKAFDQKKVYARFIYHGLNPPSPSQHIDTKQIAKKVFGFTSNSLAHMTEFLGCAKKSEHKKFPGMELWKECLKGNVTAWKEMEKYNKQDVTALEDLYNKLRPWDTSVNVALDRPNACRSCGGTSLHAKDYKVTTTGKYRRFVCQTCGAHNRSATNLMPKNHSKKIIRSA